MRKLPNRSIRKLLCTHPSSVVVCSDRRPLQSASPVGCQLACNTLQYWPTRRHESRTQRKDTYHKGTTFTRHTVRSAILHSEGNKRNDKYNEHHIRLAHYPIGSSPEGNKGKDTYNKGTVRLAILHSEGNKRNDTYNGHHIREVHSDPI
jgi:hypothetical protein